MNFSYHHHHSFKLSSVLLMMDNVQSFLNLKGLSLFLLSIQSLTYGLILPLSRKPNVDGNRFFAPSGVLLMEFFKIIISIIGLYSKHFYNRRKEGQREQNIYLPVSREDEDEKDEEKSLLYTTSIGESSTKTVVKINESYPTDEKEAEEGELQISNDFSIFQEFKQISILSFQDVWNIDGFNLAIPSILYVIQNNLQLFSANYLNSTEFQIFSQFKLVTTALFSVLILKKSLNKQHWISIILLCFGIVMVKGIEKIFSHQQQQQQNSSISPPELWTIGIPSILAACCFPGLAGILIELRLKGKKNCFWSSNFQLASFSFLFALIPIIFDSIKNHHFKPFRHFSNIVWLMIFINVIGGVLVSMVIKYADNILKNFAISISVILTIFLSSFLNGTTLTILQVLGAILVASSTIAYALAHSPPEDS